jgi:hypothetical protein
MNPQEEAKDLAVRPLPEITTERDKTLPSQIWRIDNQISILKEEIADLEGKRKDMLDRAVKMKIMRDTGCSIEIKEVNAPRNADPELLRKKFPDQFQTYVKMRIDEIKSKYALKSIQEIDNVEKKINLELADKVFGKKNVNLCSAFSVGFEYVVKRNSSELME